MHHPLRRTSSLHSRVTMPAANAASVSNIRRLWINYGVLPATHPRRHTAGLLDRNRCTSDTGWSGNRSPPIRELQFEIEDVNLFDNFNPSFHSTGRTISVHRGPCSNTIAWNKCSRQAVKVLRKGGFARNHGFPFGLGPAHFRRGLFALPQQGR